MFSFHRKEKCSKKLLIFAALIQQIKVSGKKMNGTLNRTCRKVRSMDGLGPFLTKSKEAGVPYKADTSASRPGRAVRNFCCCHKNTKGNKLYSC